MCVAVCTNTVLLYVFKYNNCCSCGLRTLVELQQQQTANEVNQDVKLKHPEILSVAIDSPLDRLACLLSGGCSSVVLLYTTTHSNT